MGTGRRLADCDPFVFIFSPTVPYSLSYGVKHYGDDLKRCTLKQTQTKRNMNLAFQGNIVQQREEC